MSSPASTCAFDLAWVGRCKNEVAGDGPMCAIHAALKCRSCGAPATRDCPETGQFVCGEPLCSDCEHRIFADGTNGGIGFNAAALAPGERRHVRKTEQVYKDWFIE